VNDDIKLRSHIDVLGHRPERNAAFSEVLLSETHDPELDALVAKAAEALASPLALVSLVLDHVQFFKAYHGLPEELAASRGTSRSASFCQFVVRDGEPFVVTDAANDARVPQHVVDEYDIRAYLGMPLSVGDTVLGSLCVMDTKTREFSPTEHAALASLAELVRARLVELATSRQRLRRELSEPLTSGAVAELRGRLEPVLDHVGAARPALSAIGTALRHYEHLLRTTPSSAEVGRDRLESAQMAVKGLGAFVSELESSSVDCEDVLTAMSLLTSGPRRAQIVDVVFAAQDLARAATDAVGGAPLPALPADLEIAAPRPLAVAVLSTCVIEMATAMSKHGLGGGLDISIEVAERSVTIGIAAAKLDPAIIESVWLNLRAKVADDISFKLDLAPDGVAMRFPRPLALA
jgi:GAF domain-containing protein